MSLYVAGAGPGNINLLTTQVVSQIKKADIVVGFERIADDIKQIYPFVIKLKTINEILTLPYTEKNVLVLASGDPNFFGITNYLKNNGIKIEQVFSGVSSMQYFMNRIQKQWHNVSFYSFHGRTIDFYDMRNKPCFFILTDKINNPDEISSKLKKAGFNGKIFVGYNLSYSDEIIEEYKIGDRIIVKSFLNVVMVENEIY